MKMNRIWLLLLTCLACSVLKPNYATAQQKIPTNVLNYINKLGADLIEENLSKLYVPRISGSGKLGWWIKYNYELKNLRVKSFDVGQTKISSPSANKLRINVNGAKGNLNVGYFKIMVFKGSISVDFSSVNLDILLNVKKLSNGKPQVNIESCSSSIGSLRLKFSNTGANWIYNLASKLFNGAIKKAVNKQICKMVKSPSLVSQLNTALGKTSIQLP